VDILGVGLKEKRIQPPSASSGDRRWGGRSWQKEGLEMEVVVAVMLERTLRWDATRIDSSNVAYNTRTSPNSSFADPHYVNTDPDPAFHLNAGPDPTVYFNADPDPAPN
jgi:hypothetical protein